MKNIHTRLGIIVFIVAIVFFVGIVIKESNSRYEVVAYNEFLEMVEEKQVETATISDGPKVKFTLLNNTVKYETDNPRTADFKELLLTSGVTVTESSYSSPSSLIQAVITIAFIGAGFYYVQRLMGKNNPRNAMALNAAQLDDNKATAITFEQIAGNDEAKESVSDIVDFIKNPQKYSDYGARMPRGIIFYGNSGTGKTLMAKAIAGEAGVPFFAVSGSDFVQMYVGVGAARIRELFSKARECGKAVIFIDEIDALGKKRSATAIGGNEERDQTLNALLTEMSGFNSDDGIIVIAATNRLDILDDALLRPGRFDRQIEIGLPDLSARKKILLLYMKNKPLDGSANIDDIAKQTVYFSGAMLENLINEAAINAAKDGTGQITEAHIDSAYYTIIAGREKKDRTGIGENDRKVTAYHEAGHGIVSKIVSPQNTVSKITIIPSSKGAGGFCVNIPPDKMFHTKKEIEAKIMIDLAGRAAEEFIFGSEYVTTGAVNDIEKASLLIKDYVSKYGMSSKTGLLNTYVFGVEKDVLTECSHHIETLYNAVKQVIEKNMEKLDAVAAYLLENETINEKQLDEIMSYESQFKKEQSS